MRLTRVDYNMLHIIVIHHLFSVKAALSENVKIMEANATLQQVYYVSAACVNVCTNYYKRLITLSSLETEMRSTT